MERILYFDNAATSFPKPASVISGVNAAIKHSGGNPGRSAHRLSIAAADEVLECREKAASFFGGVSDNVVFTLNATYALNLALKAVIKKGDHVLISDIEHNSVLRPVAAMASKGIITYDVYEASADREAVLASIRMKMRENTSLICACHHSNICNLLQPIGDIGEFCRKRGVKLLVDASQSAGCFPIDMQKDCIDILCAPGHKGLYGIMGCGFVIFGTQYDFGSETNTVFEGGNGIASKELMMPNFLPERFEAGTLSLPAISALSAGLDFVKNVGIRRIRENDRALFRLAEYELSRLPGVTVHDKTPGPILLLSLRDVPSEALAAELDRYGACVRAGFHCAPLAHSKLGTPSHTGACRISFGAFNTEAETKELCRAFKSIIRYL